MAVRGLKAKIIFNVALLLLISTILTDFLVVTIMQSVMVRTEISNNRKQLEKYGLLFFQEFSNGRLHSGTEQPSIVILMMAQDEIATVLIEDKDGNPLFHKYSIDYPVDPIKAQNGIALKDRKASVNELGLAWAVYLWHPSAYSISVPVYGDETTQLKGVIGGIVPVTHILSKIRRYHNPIFLLIILNTIILSIVGLYRIFRLYLRPIDRVIRQADSFDEGEDLFFAFRQEDNELNRLSSSLNRMLTRISSDKKALQVTVESLEKTNVELKNAQKEIIRAEKMASIGRLASGIAHEIGNPIGIVLGYLDMLKQKNVDEQDRADFLNRTEDEVQRINTIIRQLLDLARPKDTRNESVIVNTVVETIAEVMKFQSIMNDIDLDLDLLAEADTIWGNADQLRQVFLNLMLNAADAINTAGGNGKRQIKIRTGNVSTNEIDSKVLLNISFEDSGSGIEPEDLQTIFDPFYTTKEPGKGTGLGLAVSYMIVEGMGGTISAHSKPGSGATFTIELPIIEAEKEVFT